MHAQSLLQGQPGKTHAITCAKGGACACNTCARQSRAHRAGCPPWMLVTHVTARRWYYLADKLGMLVWQDMPSMFGDGVR